MLTKFVRQIVRNNMARIVDLNTTGFQDAITMAIESLKLGNVIALPTDTVYGVAALAQSTEAVNKLYNIKERNAHKPIAICVGELQDVARWGINTVSNELLHNLIPGPVTVVLQRTKLLNSQLNPNTDLVGIRIPDHDFIRQVVSKLGEPLALTSANISISQSTLCIQEFQVLWPKLDLIFDGGVLSNCEESRLGSTVVDLSKSEFYKIIRTGSAHRPTVDILNRYGLKELR